MLLREEKDKERRYLLKEANGSGWHSIEDGNVYIIDIEEDEEMERERRKNAKPIEFYKPEAKSGNNTRIEGITKELKGLSMKELEEKGEKYRELIEARDLEDILYN